MDKVLDRVLAWLVGPWGFAMFLVASLLMVIADQIGRP